MLSKFSTSRTLKLDDSAFKLASLTRINSPTGKKFSRQALFSQNNSSRLKKRLLRQQIL
jgi:hypothetical protein